MKIPTYQEQLNFVDRGFAVKSVNGNLTTFKYSRKVMYDNLWNKIPGILECRGHTYDNQTGELVVLPLMKTFNYKENDWSHPEIALNRKVTLHTKFNGFMGAVSCVKENEFIFSTTGSTKSEYAEKVQEMFTQKLVYDYFYGTEFTEEKHNLYHPNPGYTCLYEVIRQDDPHIVDSGLNNTMISLGIRDHTTGDWYPDHLFSAELEFGEALEFCKTNKGEGWMVYYDSTQAPFKLKTDYYVYKKKLMRMSASWIDRIFDTYTDEVYCNWPKTWYNVARAITIREDKYDWCEMLDQERRVIIEQIYEEYKCG